MLKFADYITILALVSGFISIIFMFQFQHFYAVIALLIAIFFDAIDGKIARKLNSKKGFELGKQLDTLSDMVNFGVTIPLLGYSMGMNSYYEIAILIFYSVCAMLRLARFNITSAKQNKLGFTGIPTTLGALIVLILFGFGTYNYIPEWFFIFYFVIAMLMISDLKLKKF